MRIKSHDGIAITVNGICKLVNISKEGISFKCVDDCSFPAEWSMDIYDTMGSCVEHLIVTKAWEKRQKNTLSLTPFSVEVGGYFKYLSSSQKKEINSYLLELSEVAKTEQTNN